ncbi:amino acid ABC transporter permease [Paralimibaculum aggregatum]|uniref:Amino acid ABC transporter permease n=1 Tax=Paralimibaculum aggregatum TaxID=3036245 RepID=A0ABQ6LSZ8_9RHOB|nr:amino acid ABC transporter permease [Limibaculum sp. NKW23]GMG85196.1 amino acid ABC transporter permease [Limibaculum sp. NKW23]
MSKAIHWCGTVVPPRAAPRRDATVWTRLRNALFRTPMQGAITLVLALLLAGFAPGLVEWALIDAVWLPSDPAACTEPGAGACWAVVSEKYRVMLFGAFPYSEHWRALLAMLLIVAGFVYSAFPRHWRARLAAIWLGLLALVLWLMLGGFGLRPLSTSDWGGLPLTLILFAGTVTFGMPLSLFLALGRESQLPAFRWICIGMIELFRGLPLLVVLFLASLLIPLFLGDGMTIDKFVRALVGMVLFFGAYASEIIRGGLQALPRGQYESARALGLTYWPMMITVILPQALRIVVPALVNDIIRAFKNTSFVAVIGLFDFLGATKAALEDPLWVRYSLEAYLFLIAVYFAFCWTMSRYASWVERRLDISKRRGE